MNSSSMVAWGKRNVMLLPCRKLGRGISRYHPVSALLYRTNLFSQEKRLHRVQHCSLEAFVFLQPITVPVQESKNN